MSPSATGKGIGSRLLAWAHDFASNDCGCTRITLDVMKKNQGAVRLYERKGYEVVKENRDCVTGCFVDCCMGCTYWSVLTMEKKLVYVELS